MTKGERAAQGPVGKLSKPTEPLFPKTPQQVRSPGVVVPLVVVFVITRNVTFSTLRPVTPVGTVAVQMGQSHLLSLRLSLAT